MVKNAKAGQERNLPPRKPFNKVGRSNKFHDCDQGRTEHLPFERYREKTIGIQQKESWFLA